MLGFNVLLLAGGLLVFISLLAGVMSARLGLPFLLVFLLAGMFVGVDGPLGVPFADAPFTAWVGNTALGIILLEGGISTRPAVFRAGLRPALVLATFGVALTAVVVGAASMVVMNVEWRHALLLGAIVGSTDAAAVFSVLRQSGLRLGERVAATLEIESGLNDPVAVFLVLAAIAMIKADAGGFELAWLLAGQFGFGALVGIAAGRGVSWLLQRLPLNAEHGGVLALIIASSGLAVFGAAGLVDGSGFLAIYLFGLGLRTRAEGAVHAAASALDGFAWAAQATIFLLLGLLVAPHDLLSRLWPTLTVAAVLIFIARPLAVWLCLAPMGFGRRERLFIGWVGLRGAVPIVLALYPLMEKVPDSYRFFNVAFAVVIASLLLQGMTLGWVARRLGMVQAAAAPMPDGRAVQGQLMLDADLPLSQVFGFLQLPQPQGADPSLRDWLVARLARDPVEGDGVDWHGARLTVAYLHDGRIVRVALTQAARGAPPPASGRG